MADKKISQLPELINANINPNDSIPIVDSVAGQTKQIKMSQLDLRYRSLPTGGATGTALVKLSPTNGDAGWVVLTKAMVGLANVDNTSDNNKPISSATQTALNAKANTSALSSYATTTYVNTQLANKQDALPSGTDGYVLTLDSGVPTWQPGGGGGGGAVDSVFGRVGVVVAMAGDYTKADVGLGDVDNTSDDDKPLSSAAITALSGKQDSLPVGTNGYVLKLVGGVPTWQPTSDDASTKNFGDPTVNGNWRLTVISGAMTLQKRESSAWVDKAEWA